MLTIFSPQENTYGVVSAPSSIDQALPALGKRYGIGLPLSDFLVPNPYAAMMQHVTTGEVVGPSVLNGAYTTQLAFRQPDIDWQIWVEDSQTPLPRRLVITDRTQPGAPQYTVTLSNWNTNLSCTADQFNFTPPANAKKITVMPVPQGKKNVGPCCEWRQADETFRKDTELTDRRRAHAAAGDAGVDANRLCQRGRRRRR